MNLVGLIIKAWAIAWIVIFSFVIYYDRSYIARSYRNNMAQNGGRVFRSAYIAIKFYLNTWV
jgi:hypothetical protein